MGFFMECHDNCDYVSSLWFYLWISRFAPVIHFFYILTLSHTSLTCWISACFKNPFTSCVNLCNFSYAFWIIFPPLVLNWSLLCCAVALNLTSTLLQYSSFSIQFSFLFFFFPLCHCSASVKVGRYSKVHC